MKMKGHLENERGEFTFGCLVMTVLIGVAAWHAWVFGMPYYRNTRFGTDLQDFIQGIQSQPSDDVAQRVMAEAATFGVVLKPEQVKTTRSPGRVAIDVSYQVTASTPLITRVFDFSAHAERQYSQ